MPDRHRRRPRCARPFDGIHRLFAPFIPFVTDEVWSWWQQGSVHSQPWPAPAGGMGDSSMLDPVGEVLATIRRTKTEAKTSQKTQVSNLVVSGPAAATAMIEAAATDLCDAGSVASLLFEPAEALTYTVTLAPLDQTG